MGHHPSLPPTAQLASGTRWHRYEDGGGGALPFLRSGSVADQFLDLPISTGACHSYGGACAVRVSVA
eukprot:5515709-Pyramimonas_sp.AAC.1